VTGRLHPQRSTFPASVGHEPAGPRLASYQGKQKSPAAEPSKVAYTRARSEAAMLPELPRVPAVLAGSRGHAAPTDGLSWSDTQHEARTSSNVCSGLEYDPGFHDDSDPQT